MKKILCGVAMLIMLAMPVYGNDEIYKEPRRGAVVGTNVNVRANPSTNAKIVIKLPTPGTPVRAHELSEHENRYWYKVELLMVAEKGVERSGWIAAEFVELYEEEEESEVTYVKLPEEMWGFTIGMRKSEIKGLEQKRESSYSSYFVRKKINITKNVEIDVVHCDFDKNNVLERVSVEVSGSKKKMNEIYRYVLATYGETKDFGEYGVDRGGDGVSMYYTDKDTGLVVCLRYYAFQHLDFETTLSFGKK